MNTNWPKCYDTRGHKDCFACKDIKGKLSCICLNDTKKVPCPFYKSVEQVASEDPKYHYNLMNHNKKDFKSYRKEMK